MNKAELVKTFLQKGAQIQPDALEALLNNPSLVQFLLERLEKTKLPIVDGELIQELLKPSFRVLRDIKIERRQCNLVEVVACLLHRYERLKQFLEPQLPACVSINKLSDSSWIIGMVSELGEGWVKVEDPSGQVSVRCEAMLLPNTVVALKCKWVEENYEAVEVVWPDVPTRPVKKAGNGWCAFISDLHLNERPEALEQVQEKLRALNPSYTFVLGDVSPRRDELEQFLNSLPGRVFFLKGELDACDAPDACWVEVEGLKLLLMHGQHLEPYLKRGKVSQILLNLLRSRHLHPLHVGSSDPYLLEEVPDVLVTGHVHEATLTNYKGITLLSLGSALTQTKYWALNLGSREVVEL